MSAPDPIVTAAAALAELVGHLAAHPNTRRADSTRLYAALQAAGLPEPAAAALQHQIVRVADGLPGPIDLIVEGGIAPEGNPDVIV